MIKLEWMQNGVPSPKQNEQQPPSCLRAAEVRQITNMRRDAKSLSERGGIWLDESSGFMSVDTVSR